MLACDFFAVDTARHLRRSDLLGGLAHEYELAACGLRMSFEHPHLEADSWKAGSVPDSALSG